MTRDEEADMALELLMLPAFEEKGVDMIVIAPDLGFVGFRCDDGVAWTEPLDSDDPDAIRASIILCGTNPTPSRTIEQSAAAKAAMGSASSFAMFGKLVAPVRDMEPQP